MSILSLCLPVKFCHFVLVYFSLILMVDSFLSVCYAIFEVYSVHMQ